MCSFRRNFRLIAAVFRRKYQNPSEYSREVQSEFSGKSENRAAVPNVPISQPRYGEGSGVYWESSRVFSWDMTACFRSRSPGAISSIVSWTAGKCVQNSVAISMLAMHGWSLNRNKGWKLYVAPELGHASGRGIRFFYF